jgi:hypothetical protein
LRQRIILKAPRDAEEWIAILGPMGLRIVAGNARPHADIGREKIGGCGCRGRGVSCSMSAERPRLVTRLFDPSGALKIRHEHLANERPRSAEAPARQHIARIVNSEIYAANTDQQGQDRGGHYEMNAN